MEQERYHRQTILDKFGQENQLKLKRAKVLVIGAGGLGCPVLQYLAAMGVGVIGIADDDHIALSNLHRQVLYSTSDVGKLKVSQAAMRLKEMNPEIEIISHHLRLNSNNILGILTPYDFIFDGTDNFETRYLINDCCALLKKPLVFAAVSAYEGQLAIFNTPDENGLATNYRDLFPIAPKPGEIANCEENGVLGVLPGIIGSMAAAEIVKLITGIGKPLINKLLHYNLLTNEQYVLHINKGIDYQLPKTENEILQTADSFVEINIEQLTALKLQSSTLLVDVRETHELPLLNTSDFKKAPMSSFEDFLASDIAAKDIVLICQHGIRSQAAAEALHEKYGAAKNIFSLKGGIVKWKNYFS